MASNSIVITGDIRFTKLLRVMNKKVKKNVGKATKKNALILRKGIRKSIGSKKYERNKKITEILKGKNFPLVDKKEMIQAIEIKQKDEFEAEVGFITNQTASHGGSLTRIAEILHDGTVAAGAKIKITDKMRRFFFGMVRKLEPGAIKDAPTKSSGFIKIKGRPFFTNAVEDKKTIATINKNWNDAVNKSIQS